MSAGAAGAIPAERQLRPDVRPYAPAEGRLPPERISDREAWAFDPCSARNRKRGKPYGIREHMIMRILLKKPWGIFCLALLLLVPLLLLADIPQRDVLSRYAPMARAIAEGDWSTAFHSRVPFGFPLLGAIVVKLFGCEGFTGVKIVSVLCFALTVFPLWKIFRRVFDETTARTGCVLLVFCSYWLRLASGGLRESAKLLFLAWTVYGLLCLCRKRRRLKGYLIAGCGCGAMAAIRDDSLLAGAAIGVALLILEVHGTRRFPWRSCVAGMAGAVILFPGLWINYQLTGYSVPSGRLIGMAEKVMKPDMFGRTPSGLPRLQPGGDPFPKGNLWSPPPPQPPAVPGTDPGPKPEPGGFQPVTWTGFFDFLTAVVKGNYFWFIVPALIVIAFRLRRREWSEGETLLLAVWLGHGLLIVLQILVFDRYLYVSRRYLLPATPLAFGWTALALQASYRYALVRFPAARVRRTAVCAAVLAGGFFYLDALAPQLKMRFDPGHAEERTLLRDWSSRIREEYHGPARQTSEILRCESYATFRRPLVAGNALPELGFLAGGEGCGLSPESALGSGLRPDFLAEKTAGHVPDFPEYRLLGVRRAAGKSYALYMRERR